MIETQAQIEGVGAVPVYGVDLLARSAGRGANRISTAALVSRALARNCT